MPDKSEAAIVWRNRLNATPSSVEVVKRSASNAVFCDSDKAEKAVTVASVTAATRH